MRPHPEDLSAVLAANAPRLLALVSVLQETVKKTELPTFKDKEAAK